MNKYLNEIEKLSYREFSEYSRIEVLDWGVCVRSGESERVTTLACLRSLGGRQNILLRSAMMMLSCSIFV